MYDIKQRFENVVDAHVRNPGVSLDMGWREIVRQNPKGRSSCDQQEKGLQAGNHVSTCLSDLL